MTLGNRIVISMNINPVRLGNDEEMHTAVREVIDTLAHFRDAVIETSPMASPGNRHGWILDQNMNVRATWKAEA